MKYILLIIAAVLLVLTIASTAPYGATNEAGTPRLTIVPVPAPTPKPNRHEAYANVTLTPVTVPPTVPPTPMPTLAPEPTPQAYQEGDAELIARVLYNECRGEPREGQIAVVQCVLDRVESGIWGSTVLEVLTYPNQFTEPGELTDELLDAARSVLDGVEGESGYVILYFAEAQEVKSDWYAPYLFTIGGHDFYGYERANEGD